MNLQSDIQYLKGVGPALAKKLNSLGVRTIEDLLYFFPRRYEDRTKLNRASQIPQLLDQHILLKGRILKVQLLRPRPKYFIVKAEIEDINGGTFRAVWFNQRFLKDSLLKDRGILVSGKVSYNSYEHKFEVAVEDHEFTGDRSVEIIVPFYDLTEGLYQKKIRQLTALAIAKYLPELIDPFPKHLREQVQIELKAALNELHYPTDRKRWKLAHDRLVFDEFLYVELGMALRYYQAKHSVKGINFSKDGELLKKYYTTLPYILTNAQQRVTAEILSDMCSDKVMNRMVQGDVGSGKTDVAIIALLCAVQSGYQAAIMVPTEILALQHFAKLQKRLTELGVRVVSLLGRHTAKEKTEIYQKLKDQQADIVIGTHAVIQEKVQFAKLGFAIIDEQHRFGVVQRQELKAKGEANLDLLVMTATPIPRTLALTVYGDLDKSIIDEMPPERTPIKTHHVHPGDRIKLYEFCKQELRKRHQIYIVYPLIEESEKIDLKAAVESYEYIRKNIFTEYKVGLLHGRLKDQEKAEIMDKFRNKEIDILVSTTVIEVGVDVPNATIMLIENAERFGLSQLHQLRGRVGRGEAKSYCFLVGELKSQEAKRRINALVASNDGFKIAETDLELRGPGDFVGIRQAGFPDFILADFIKDEQILLKAREAAFSIVEKDQTLLTEDNYLLKKNLLKRSRGLVGHIFLN